MGSVRSRITITYATGSLLIVSLLSILLSFEIERYFLQERLGGLRTEANAVAALIQLSVARREPRGAIVEEMSTFSFSHHMRITLIDSTGVVLYDSAVPDSLLSTLENHLQRPEVFEASRAGSGSNIRTSNSIHQELVYVAQTVTISGDNPRGAFPRLGYVRVSVDMEGINYVMYEIRFKIALAAIAILLVVAFASQIIARRLSNPLTEIAAMVNEIKQGNLNQRLPVRSNDEVGRLAELVNELTEKLRSDIEQQKKLERVRSEFLGNVSHELRTPIFSLKGFLETLIDGAIDDPSVNKIFTEKAYHHANRLDSLLSDLIEISRIESGEMKMSFRYFDISAMLKTIVTDFADAAGRKKQNLILDIPDHEVLVLGDRDRLRQAIGNIVSNAIKYCPPESTTTVHAVESEQGVTISVSDNGPGIEAVHLPRIFERFYRVDKTRSREVGGTGLGLAIVKHIVEAHGSRIIIASEIGKGTTFSFNVKK